MLNTVHQNSPLDETTRAEIAFAFQRAVVDTLRIKCDRALTETGYSRLVVAGGVGANRCLRKVLDGLAGDRGGRVHYPAPEYCTDNGAMIAYAGAMRLLAGQNDEDVFDVLPRWSIEKLSPLARAD